MTSAATVLVVDGDVAVRGRLGASLRAAGCEVVEAERGDGAFAELSQRRVDVVVIDMRMPCADDLALCRELHVRWRIPVVVLSPPTTPADAVAFLDAGVDGYMTKPIATEVLAARIRSLLRRPDRLHAP